MAPPRRPRMPLQLMQALRKRFRPRNTAGMPNHPVRDDIDLLDGNWYATEPHDDWTWMREHAPVYYDPTSDVWAITKYDDVLAIEKDAKGFSSYKAPRPHGMP